MADIVVVISVEADIVAIAILVEELLLGAIMNQVNLEFIIQYEF
ncbi:hypothetical protein CLK_3632 [Clostridium botulinum A3 str. Loch Maree]|nr:hypothetical protein CLK_3632 [Clostridium botulinum A3 str. Loch Maree]